MILQPQIEINDFYKNILKSENSSSITSKYLKEKLESAMWLIKILNKEEIHYIMLFLQY